jgi:hypothetical protein
MITQEQLDKVTKELQASLAVLYQELQAEKTARLELEKRHKKVILSNRDRITELENVPVAQPTEKLEKVVAKPTTSLTNTLEKLEEGLNNLEIDLDNDFHLWILGASLNKGILEIDLTTKATNKSNLPAAASKHTHLLEIHSRLNYVRGEQDFVAKPRAYMPSKISVEKGALSFGQSTTPEQWQEFLTYDFSSIVFWRYHSVTQICLSKPAVAILFYAHFGFPPLTKELDHYMKSANLTRPEIPSVKFALGGFHDADKNQKWLSDISSIPREI